MRIIQMVPSLNYGDAIGNYIIAIKHIIEDMGYKTAIYCNNIHEKITEPDVYLASELNDLKTTDVVIYHMSIGDELNHIVAAYKCRKIMIYHNITPPHFFEIDCAEKVDSCRRGLEDVKALAGKFDHCIAVSDFNRRDLISMGYDADTIDVVPIIVALDDYKQKPDQEIIDHYNDGYTNILFVGRVAPNKKHEDMIRAFAYYKENINPKSRLILAGSHGGLNNYYTDLVAYIEELGVKDIEFTSHISFAGILGLYKSADVFLCMSEHEGFCVPLVEAMVFDVPIIAYDCCAVPETMGGSGIVVDNKNPVFLAKVIDRVVNDEALRKHMIETERKRLDDFRFEPLSKQFRKILETFLDGVKKKSKKVTSQYSVLYDIVNNRMKKSGSEIPFSKDVFLNCSELAPGHADIASLIDSNMDNKSFFEAAYYTFFYRLPTPNEYEFWDKDIKETSTFDFQKKLSQHLVDIVNSEDFTDIKINVCSNLFSRN